MQIKHTIERFPGGMMIVPLITGAIVATLSPGLPRYFGSFTGALFTGALPILAVFFVCTGSTVSLQSLPQVLRRGGALLITKIALGLGAAFLLGRLIGAQPIQSGWLRGVSTLAVVAAINDTNGGLYIALMNQFGRPRDAASYSVMALESGPFFTMVALGVAGLSSFPWQTMVGAILPLAIGMSLGSLDPDLRNFLSGAIPVLIPFFAFALGATLNLKLVWAAGLLGIGLGLTTLVISGAALLAVDRMIGGNGVAGLAAATTAGNAGAVPMLVAAANPLYAPAAGSATVLVSASVIITAFLAPLLTSWWARRVETGGLSQAATPGRP